MAEYGKECRLHARHFRSANFSAYRRVDPISSQEAGDAAKKNHPLEVLALGTDEPALL